MMMDARGSQKASRSVAWYCNLKYHGEPAYKNMKNEFNA